MKESGKECFKYVVYESTRAPLTRSPFPDGEGLGGATLRVDFYKGALPENRWITGFPFMVSDTIRFTANNKDVSLALEMTTQESTVPHSLEEPNPQPLIPSQ